jgi:hypothetical protein
MTFCPEKENRSDIETRRMAEEVRQKPDPFKSLKRDWLKSPNATAPFRAPENLR